MPRIICEVVDYGGSTGGSFIPALQSLAEACRARNDHLAVIAAEVPGASWTGELIASGATVVTVRTERDAVRILHELRPDIVHSHFFRFDRSVLQAAAHSRIFWHVHSHRQNPSRLAHLKAYAKYRYFGRKVEALVAVSHTIASECVAYSASPGWIRVVPNGIDTRHFRIPTPAERAEARASLGIAEGDRVVLFFERLPYKGGATLRAALKQMSGVRLLVAGGTPEARTAFGDPPGVISIARAPDARLLYWAADALAFASSNEAFGLVITEALACGLPIAASDIPVVREICDGEPSVVRYPSGDSRALADALNRALTINAANGRDRVVHQYSLERWTEGMLKLYAG